MFSGGGKLNIINITHTNSIKTVSCWVVKTCVNKYSSCYHCKLLAKLISNLFIAEAC